MIKQFFYIKFMRYLFFFIFIPFNFFSQELLKKFVCGDISKDQFLIDQKWTDIDSVSGFYFDPIGQNKKVDLVNWIFKSDFTSDQTFYLQHELINSLNGVKIEILTILYKVTNVKHREIWFIYQPNSGILSDILDSDLDK